MTRNNNAETGLKSAPGASAVERAAKAIADGAYRQDFVITPDEFDALSDDEIVFPTSICDDEIESVEGTPRGLARLTFASIDVDELARAIGDAWPGDAEIAYAIKARLTGGAV